MVTLQLTDDAAEALRSFIHLRLETMRTVGAVLVNKEARAAMQRELEVLLALQLALKSSEKLPH